MRLPAYGLVLLAVAMGPVVRPVAAQEVAEAAKVRQGLERAVDYLQREQGADGTWQPEWLGQPGGVTALCTLALLNAGVPAEEEHVAKALKYLRTLPPSRTYVTSLQTMVFCAARSKMDLPLIRRNAKWLEETQIPSGENKGAWSYPGASGDNSNSQFALLALHEAERVGVPVGDPTWRLALGYWQRCQNPDGSWNYMQGMPGGTGSMTSAGITSVIIASGRLSEADAAAVGREIQCCAAQAKKNDAVERGLAWLERNFSVSNNPGSRGQPWLLYYLYGVERVGRMTARRFIGQHDWYREGVDELLRPERQDPISGFIVGPGRAENDRHLGTALGLLFLAKGRRPVLMAKLRHLPENDWNNHRHDVANLTSYVETRWARDLTWQVIDAKVATVDDYLQVPVLFLSGNEAPQFTDEQARALRDYLDRGGFLFAEACCEGKGFDQGFRELMARVFPEPEYRLRLLGPEHPVWFAEERVDPAHLHPLWGIDAGCRTSVVYVPPEGTPPKPSLSCLWELAGGGREIKYAPEVQAQIAAAESIGINVLAYATNRELKFKYEIPRAVEREKPQDKLDRGKLYIATLAHPGGCDVAPRAVVNLLNSAARELKIRVGTEHRLLPITDPTLFDYHLVFMHGQRNFSLTAAERKQLRTYVERGGMVFADSICASPQFDAAFRREMKAVFADKAMERIPVTHPLFSPTYGGFNLASVTRREPSSRAGGGPMKANLVKVEPYLEGIKFDGRFGVIYSRYDLSCALENQGSMDCNGYTREDAARIGLNVVLYSLQQ
ncbi:MAG: DUF4159 domain-containing protein [Pirellulales bacterium]